jgi:hypothetical protein
MSHPDLIDALRSDAELVEDRLLQVIQQWDALLAALKLIVDHFGDPLNVARQAIAQCEAGQ